ncbi:MAG: sulfotransferase domain-containing protein, partial [Pseudomonadota bacterium]
MTDLLLPHFIIIGAMKSGTTTLYRHLDEHPDVDMSRDKETDLFVSEKNWSRGLGWYSNQFSRADAVRGEASPNYSKSRDFPGVAKRM